MGKARTCGLSPPKEAELERGFPGLIAQHLLVKPGVWSNHVSCSVFSHPAEPSASVLFPKLCGDI